MIISYIKSYSIAALIAATLILNPVPLYSNPSYPNFTEVVEKNIPAVVIVHAKKKITGNSNIIGNMPNLPEELKPFLDKFFDGENNNPGVPRKAPSFGSGFILTKDGYIMTNNHVIANADEIKITLSDQTELSAKLVGSDKRSDLALLKVDAAANGTAAQLKTVATICKEHRQRQQGSHQQSRVADHDHADVHNQPARAQRRHQGRGLLQPIGQGKTGKSHTAKGHWGRCRRHQRGRPVPFHK